MVATLGPGKFYGSALPRPRIYTDVKFSEGRVDPPPSVVDPLLSWAKEAHWSMGGLSFARLRLQGQIVGKISMLRAQKEKESKAKEKEKGRGDLKVEFKKVVVSEEEEEPPMPEPLVAQKRRRRLVEEREDEVVGESKRKRLKRKLYEEFDAVAKKSDVGCGSNEGQRTSPKTSKNGGTADTVIKGENEIVCSTNGRLRVSPRLAKLAKGGSDSSSRRVSRKLVKSG